MRQAIITGGTGLVGSALARYLDSRGVMVLCLGRRPLDPANISQIFGGRVAYLNLAMNDIGFLPQALKEIPWALDKSTVFFHFAWSGAERLSDGNFSDQLSNAIHAAEAVRIAKDLGCTRFVNAGTLEETFLEGGMLGTREKPYASGQTNYALAKLTSRDMCKMVAYVEKIDYVHTRLSVPVAPDLSRGTYVTSVIKKIIRGEEYETPKNEQLFDIVSTDDVACAYYMIGRKGRNKADYFIGTSQPATLQQYFLEAERLVRGTSSQPATPIDSCLTGIFSTEKLRQDTGFIVTTQFHQMIKCMLQK